MTKKMKMVLAAVGVGIGLATSANATPGNWEQRYCAENPRDCYCEYRGGRKYCFIL
ncbi:hypothetical protein SG34_025150 [Thalassomonas viridans]|uniref:Uncharacterized protein n=1 Tax=Thalassomonas viridans TaxID=137584 RepID=A0AAE9Z1L9_9GAMM|nr:hypothetical protein [Thalassomonas viridans]WDE04582.1 hypothetical protein SG34_025150 [Thalassomonas viridans]